MRKLFISFILVFTLSEFTFSQTPVVIDLYKTYQTITALGAHDPTTQLNTTVDDLGVSEERVYIDPNFKKSVTGAYNFDAACTAPIKSDILKFKSKGVTRFFATPFTPPAYMKMNGMIADSNCYNVWDGSKKCNDPRNKLRYDMYEAYADYLVEFTKRFRDSIGVELIGLSMGNEPEFSEPYISCVYTAGEMKRLIKLVGPKLKAAGLHTKIICAETMGSYQTNRPWMDSIIADPETRQYIAAWAVHGYTDGVAADMGSATGWSSMSDYLNKYHIPLWMTETSGYLNNLDESMKLAQAIHLALRFGKVSLWSYCYSNNTFGQPQFSLMTGATKLASYWASKHYYKYIRPGAQQVESSCTDKEVLVTAFRNGADKSLTVVIINNNVSQSKSLKLQADNLPSTFTLYTTSSGGNFISAGSANTGSFTLPAKSINTLVFAGANKQPTIQRLDTLVYLMRKAGQPGAYTIDLKSISDGGGEGQTLTVSETHTNATLFSAFQLKYTNPDTTGKISFTLNENITGLASVTVSLNDGSTANNGFLSQEKMTFVIRVIPFKNNPPTINSVVVFKVQKGLSNCQISLSGISDGDDGSQKVSMSAQTSDNNIATNVYIKNYTGGSTASVNLIPRGIGDALLTITLCDNGGTDLGGQDSKVIQIKVQVLEVYDLEQTENDPVLIYPNPAHDLLKLINAGDFKEAAIYDASSHQALMTRINSNDETIDVSALQPGVYFLKLMNENKQIVKKLIIQ